MHVQRSWGRKNLAMGDLRKDLCDWSFMGQERRSEKAYGEGRARSCCVLLIWVSVSGHWDIGGLEAVRGHRMT